MTIKRANEMLAVVGHDESCELSWANNQTEFNEVMLHWELHFDKEDHSKLPRAALIERSKMLDEFIDLL
jgi:hypothetical protein